MKNEEREKGKWEKGGREKLLKNTLGKQHWLKASPYVLPETCIPHLIIVEDYCACTFKLSTGC